MRQRLIYRRQRPPTQIHAPARRCHTPPIHTAAPAGGGPGSSTRGAGIATPSSRQNPAIHPHADPVHTQYPGTQRALALADAGRSSASGAGGAP